MDIVHLLRQQHEEIKALRAEVRADVHELRQEVRNLGREIADLRATMARDYATKQELAQERSARNQERLDTYRRTSLWFVAVGAIASLVGALTAMAARAGGW